MRAQLTRDSHVQTGSSHRDKDGNGTLDKQEVRDALHALGFTFVEDKQIDQVLRTLRAFPNPHHSHKLFRARTPASQPPLPNYDRLATLAAQLLRTPRRRSSSVRTSTATKSSTSTSSSRTRRRRCAHPSSSWPRPTATTSASSHDPGVGRVCARAWVRRRVCRGEAPREVQVALYPAGGGLEPVPCRSVESGGLPSTATPGGCTGCK